MNPLFAEALGSIIRWLLAFGAGYIVKTGIWTSSQAEQYIGAATLGVLALGWSFWQKYKNRLKLVTALSSGMPMSESAVEERVKNMPTPSAKTPKDEVPEAK